MSAEMLAVLAGGPFSSEYIVPVAGCAMIFGIVAAGCWSGVRQREIQSQERLAAIAKGITPPPTPEELAIMHGKPTSDALRRRANIRLTAFILLGGALGLIVFFLALTVILHERDVLCGAAAALIPAGLGLAFLYDVQVQTREIESAVADRQ